jgi:hypothetical protein
MHMKIVTIVIRLTIFSTAVFSLLTLFSSSCTDISTIKHTSCEETCLYKLRDCSDTCNRESANISYGWKRSGDGYKSWVFICAERCESGYRRCLEKCKEN